MNLDSINRHIDGLRIGNKKSEEELYKRYIKRIRFYVYRNVWITDLKDPEDTISRAWIRLRNWFEKNHIKKSEGAVIRDLVRSVCNNVAPKDIREPYYGNEPLRSNPVNEDNDQQKEYSLLSVHKEIMDKVLGSEHHSPIENETSFKLCFKDLLVKCLRSLNETQRKVLDYYFYKELTLKEIGKLIGRSDVAIMHYRNSGIKKLRDCFNEHEVFAIGDLK
jgi:RNA polymerase sigma factor (sigma-70 family)